MIADAPTHAAGGGPADLHLLPPELRGSDRWLNWRYERRNGKDTKVPYNPVSGARIDPTDPARLMSCLDALRLGAASDQSAGLGFGFFESDGYCGIDLDDCVDESGNLSPEAATIVADFNCYAEFSPSGRGVKLFFRGRKPAWARCTSRAIEGISKIEIYDRSRFFTVTGCVVPGSGLLISERQAELDALCARLWSVDDDQHGIVSRRAVAPANADDQELLRRARAAANGARFSALFDSGDTSQYGGDDSAADAALACMLVFWCGPDRGRVESLFSESALGQRDKWRGREDYRNRTIDYAIEQTKEHFGDATVARAPARGAGGATLPEIMLDVDEHRVIDEVVGALRADPGLFARGGKIVEVLLIDDARTPVIVPLQPPRLREVITRNAVLSKLTKAGEAPCHPTGWLVNGVGCRGVWPGLRPLKLVADSPVLRPDGTVWQTPGYDNASGVLYVPGAEFPLIPSHPTRDDACAACGRLLDLVVDFPFAGPEHQAAFLAMVLTTAARHAFSGPAPMFLVDANVRGAGKTLLAAIAAAIATGRVPAVSSYVHDSTECRKQITTLAIEGAQVVLLDNLDGVIGNDALDRALTSDWWQDRVLGTNSSYAGPMLAVWIATGNNVSVRADTTRRTVYLRLDSPLEHPEDRGGFRHRDLLGHVLAERPRLLADALTIVSAYIQAGRPSMKLRPLGSFNGWSDTIRSAVRWLGLLDPCDTRDQLEVAADSDKVALRQLLTAWSAHDGASSGVTAAELVRMLYPPGGPGPDDERTMALRDALESVVAVPAGRQPTPRKIGNRLRAMKRRVINGMMLDTDAQKSSKGQVWRVVECPSGSGVTV